MTDPLATINITIPCQDNVGSGVSRVQYSGRLVHVHSQWGFLWASVDRQGGTLCNGAWTPNPIFCPGAYRICGDTHMSVHSIRVSNGMPKWVVATGMGGSTVDCDDPSIHVEGLQVWKWNGASYRWTGLIRTTRLKYATSDLRLIGNESWAPKSTGGFYRFDLNAMVIASEVASAPPDDPQASIDGFTYTFAKQDVKHMTLTRSDVVPEPELPTFCPDDKITRKQVAAIVYNAMLWIAENHPADPATGYPGIQAPAPPDEQQFSDVPMDNPFRPAIDALKAANIIAGKSPCTG